MQTFVFDIDGTICTNTFGDYFKAKPFEEKILKINKLYEEGNLIKYFTARGSGTGKDWYEVTKQQLKLWGAKYHELIMGKPEGDFYVDDKGRNAYLWDWYDEVDQDNNLNFENIIKKDLVLSLNTLGKLLVEESLIKKIVKLSRLIQQSLESGGKIIFAGNGGSFADAQHLSAEFVSRFLTDRNPLPSIALATNSSTATAIGNDYGFENIFARELEAIACRKDIFIAFSTSGNSLNIVNAIYKCKEKSIEHFVLTGESGGKCKKLFKNIINVPSDNTAIIQQLHITIGHIICKLAERKYLNPQ